MDFTLLDIWAIARAVQGLDTWQALKISPMVRTMLSSIKTPKDRIDLLRLLGTEINQQILQIADPAAEPPAPEPEPTDDITIPDLPREARLSDDAIRAAASVGRWTDDFLLWAAARSPMTPPEFLLAGALYCIGLVTSRRCMVQIHEPVYPHLFILWVARTSVYKKTTGLRTIWDTIYAATPHMLFPEEMTPEAFMGALAGKLPSNYDKLSGYDKRLIDLSLPHAAQRGILLDEASSLFSTSKKDYMAGSEELLLRGYDAPPTYNRETGQDGRLIVKDMAISLLGATTPAAFARTVDAAAWETGLTARFILLYPSGKMPYKQSTLSSKEYRPPMDLVKRLAKLHNMLPTAPIAKAIEDEEPPSRTTLSARIDRDVFPPFNAYSKALTYDMLWDKLDPALHGNYSRLPVGAEKVALQLAAIDWADEGDQQQPIRITLGHWARAQQITESWRASLHRMKHALTASKETEEEDRILSHLESRPNGETLRELCHRTGLPKKSVEQALDTLLEAGLVMSEDVKPVRGPTKTIYKPSEMKT
jgi:Protein of unknown function (DUF3987)/IclR helix-turn-helix domain